MIRNPAQPRRRSYVPRRGAALIILLAVFAVLLGLASVWTRRIVAEHRHQHRIAEQVQARWLAEAGLRRAAAQLIANSDFTGEEWSIAADDLGQSYAAAVKLTVAPDDDSPGAVRITAEARCPKNNPRVRITKSLIYSPPNREPTS